MYPCERAGLEILDDAPFRSRNSIDLTLSPQQVWEVLASVETWPQWYRLITKAAWTSPAPHRVGSTRALELVAGMAATEEVIVWNLYHHMAFRLTESSRQNTGASVEEFRIETTEHGCRLTWSTARRPRKPPSLLMRIYARPVIKRSTRRQTKRLRKHIEQRFGPAIFASG
jgi:Polyketide cyclase / dehydrase and lipid transport